MLLIFLFHIQQMKFQFLSRTVFFPRQLLLCGSSRIIRNRRRGSEKFHSQAMATTQKSLSFIISQNDHPACTITTCYTRLIYDLIISTNPPVIMDGNFSEIPIIYSGLTHTRARSLTALKDKIVSKLLAVIANIFVFHTPKFSTFAPPVQAK